MGGYYLHAMINLLGPITRVSGFAQSRHPNRIFSNTNNPLYGEKCEIDTINAMVGTLEYASGVMGTIALVSEGFGETPRIEIYGREGTLVCPNPNEFGGPVLLKRSGEKEFVQMPLTHGYVEGCCRGIGVADMAWGIINNRSHRAHGYMG